MARAYYPTGEGEYTAWTPDMVGAAAENHIHTGLTLVDNRSENLLPNEIIVPNDKGLRLDFKSTDPMGLDSSSGFIGVVTFVPWNDNSGGNVHQLALGTSSDLHPKINLRSGNQDTDTWGNWYEFYTSSRPEVVVSSSQPSNSNAKIWVKI